jgi:hypothetical protein
VLQVNIKYVKAQSHEIFDLSFAFFVKHDSLVPWCLSGNEYRFVLADISDYENRQLLI